MDPLVFLRSAISGSHLVGEKPLVECDDIDRVLDDLVARARASDIVDLPLDLQLRAVREFWRSKRLGSLKDGRLLSFSISVPSEPGGPSILEDKRRFTALLDGID